MKTPKQLKRLRDTCIWHQEAAAKARAEVIELLGRICAKCGFSDQRAINIDHVHGGGRLETKKYGPRKYHRMLEKIRQGNKDYQLLCANCNQIKRVEQQESKNKKHFRNTPL